MLLVYVQNVYTSSCFEYVPTKRLIEILCGSANITDLHNAFGPSLIKNESPGVWLLDASIKIKDGATFYINSTDTEWLKVNSTAGSAHNIIPQGNMRIDSIRLTSWDVFF